MKTDAIYRHLKYLKFSQSRADRLVGLFHQAALYLVERIEKAGWPKWRNNYLREHVGCAFGEEFTNTSSPYIVELMFRKHPGLRKYENSSGDQQSLEF
jgi:hypothetical protein